MVSARKPVNREPPRIRLSIRDNGIGIPAERLPIIFRHHETSFKDGHGIGLAVVQNIIQAYQGDVRAESEVNKGTTFYLELPLALV